MKALLYKDFISLWKYCKGYITIYLLFPFLTIFVEDYQFLKYYPLVFSGMLVTTLIAYDERDKWDKLCLALPVTRRQIVSSKYLVAIILQSAVFALTAIICAVQRKLVDDLLWGSYLLEMGGILLLGIAMPAIMLPCVFKLGSEKGRMAYLVSVVLILVVVASGGLVLAFTVKLSFGSDLLLFLLILVAVVLAYVYSWRLSVRFYEKREF